MDAPKRDFIWNFVNEDSQTNSTLSYWNVRKNIDPYTTAKSYHYTYEIDNYTDILQDR